MPTVMRGVLTCTFQYTKPEEGLGAGQWLDWWMTLNRASLHQGSASGYRVSPLIPAVTDADTSTPPANVQFDLTLHLEADTREAVGALAAQVTGALGDGGVYQAVQSAMSDLADE